ncbi:MAG: addiction module protein [Candidatus Omnitrophica bacterium]|nr:addiction module protein [Candidatus Omnitrophota bacterium]
MIERMRLCRIAHQIEKIWIAESEARYKAYKQGKIKAINYDTVKKKFTE